MDQQRNQEKIDNLYFAASEGTGTIDQLIESFFSFLSRRTDFFERTDDAKKIVLGAMDTHSQKYLERATEKKQKQQQEQQKKQQQQQQQQQQQRQKQEVVEPPRVEEIFEDDDVEETKNSKPETIVKSPTTAATTTADSEQQSSSSSSSQLLEPSAGNGAKTSKYEWTQTLGTVDIVVPLPRECTAKQLTVKITDSALNIELPDSKILSGKWNKKVCSSECVWTLEDRKAVRVSLEKEEKMSWWDCALEGEPKIDLQKVVPENSKLSDLDSETRLTVEKMMFDQRQKEMGLPTSEQNEQMRMLDMFKQQHPELDFSKAKMS